MAARSGSFGLLKPHFRVTADSVTIQRNVMLPFLLLSLAAPGIYCLAQAFGHHRMDSNMFGIGFVCVMLAAFALVMTPWLLPGKIAITRDGVQWGSAKVPRAQIVKLHALSTQLRVPGRSGGYLSWMVVLTTTTGKPLTLNLGNRQLSASLEPLQTLEAGISSVLGLTRA